MGLLDFLRETVIEPLAGDKEWTGGYSKDGESLNLYRGETKVSIRPSESKGTAVNVEAGSTRWTHAED